MFRYQGLLKYLMWTRCCRACFYGLYVSYSVHCKTPAKWGVLMWNVAPLSAAVCVDICLDVFLVCFMQNEDESRASESKKTKLEEKAPSGHKTSSSREWVSGRCSRWRLGAMEQETGAHPLPRLLLPAKCLLITNRWGKCHCFLTLQKTYLRVSSSSWGKLIPITTNVGQGRLFYWTEGNPSCEGLLCYGIYAACFGFPPMHSGFGSGLEISCASGFLILPNLCFWINPVWQFSVYQVPKLRINSLPGVVWEADGIAIWIHGFSRTSVWQISERNVGVTQKQSNTELANQ